jgi:phosphatidylglycerol:prolipoprotein diacylglycerol transferase
MISYPNFDPVAVRLGPLAIHWYGLMYLCAFALAWFLAQFRVKRYQLAWTSQDIEDLIFYAAVGVIVGGRLGYMLFYSQGRWWVDPWSIFKIWEGGMSFHGGLLGVMLALAWFARHTQRSFWTVMDFTAPIVPLGLALGRWGNFMNGELWGRVTDMPWGMIFPEADGQTRHPSQLYELGLEGIMLFMLVWWYASKPRRVGQISGVFLMGYACARILVEFFRQPDVQWGYLAWNWLTMGQLLSLPFLLLGVYLVWRKS